MSNTNDGGPAFPHVSRWVQEFSDEGKCIGCWPSGGGAGMTLRDYFAAHAPNMDIADICNVMDWDVTLPVGSPDDDQDISQEETVWTRWRELTLWQRLAADAKFRYLWADAMIAARGGGK